MNKEIFEIIQLTVRDILKECQDATWQEQKLAKKITLHLQSMSGRIQETINGLK